MTSPLLLKYMQLVQDGQQIQIKVVATFLKVKILVLIKWSYR